jgi:hypothetical protein
LLFSWKNPISSEESRGCPMRATESLKRKDVSVPPEARRNLPAFSVPQLTYNQDRWATLRAKNTETIMSLWENKPYQVRVLGDKKLAPHSLVILRKDTFEKMISLLKDLQHGDATVRGNLDAVFSSLELVERLVEESPEGKNSNLQLAVKTLTHIVGRINAEITLSAPPKPVQASELTDEERKALAELEKSEK